MRHHPGQRIADLLQGPGQRCRCAVVAFASEPGHRAFAGSHQVCGMGVPAMFGERALDVGGGQRLVAEFRQLVPQPGAATRRIALRRQQFLLAEQSAPPAGGRGDGRARHAVPRERIQQVQLAAARQQCLVFMLAVYLHQQGRELGQLRQRRRSPVDPGARATVRPQGAAQLALPVVVHVLRGQPCGRRGCIRQIEHRRQLRAFRAVADHPAVGTGAGQEAERIDQQRLARAGFTRDHGQARRKVQLRDGDHGEIADGEMGQHGTRILPCRAQNQ